MNLHVVRLKYLNVKTSSYIQNAYGYQKQLK